MRDQGVWIDPSAHEKIFERFERAATARAYGGLGLGLFVVREIARAHGGEVSVESAPGERLGVQAQLAPGAPHREPRRLGRDLRRSQVSTPWRVWRGVWTRKSQSAPVVHPRKSGFSAAREAAREVL